MTRSAAGSTPSSAEAISRGSVVSRTMNGAQACRRQRPPQQIRAERRTAHPEQEAASERRAGELIGQVRCRHFDALAVSR